MASSPGWILKKYGNRRLYDTEESRYVTLDEVARKIRRGGEPRVLDARTGADLTQATLAQIILEGQSASRLLPVPLLLRLIRMEPDVLADFFSRGLVAALDLYLHARQQAQSALALSPLGFGYGPDLFARFARAAHPWTDAFAGVSGVPAQGAPPPPAGSGGGGASALDPVTAELRREIDELRAMLRKETRPRGRRKRRRP